MGQIIFISTYRDLTIQAQELASEMGLEIDFYQGSLDDAVHIIDSIGEHNIDVCISRGGTADYVKRRYSCPVVSVDTSIYDLLECCEEVVGMNRNIAVTSYGKPFFGLYLIERVMNVSITEIVFNNMEELDRKIQALSLEGNHHVIGGGPSAICAQKYGLQSTFLRTGSATITEAFSKAIVVAQISREEKRRAFRLKTILSSIYEGVIVVDKDGLVEICNPAAEKIMKIKSEDVLGKDAGEVIPNTKLIDVLVKGQAEIKEFQDIGDVRIVTSRVPVRDGKEIIGAVATFEEMSNAVQIEHRVRREEVSKAHFNSRFTFDDIIGNSKSLTEKKKLAGKFACSDLTIMIYGQSGTGKELFAQSIHGASKRNNRPFVAINCCALPPTLLESELFGYEEGAFTGAKRKGKPGLFELAHTGTIFLDEIDGLPLDMQGRLLRVLQEREVMRVGGTAVIPVDIRIVAATNRPPEELLVERKMREDLYYRLNVLYLELPTLKERREDIPLLVKSFLKMNDICLPQNLLAEIVVYLQQYNWPGNIRELRNFVERLSFFIGEYTEGTDVHSILKSILPYGFLSTVAVEEFSELRQTVKRKEQEKIFETVRRSGSIGKAAKELGIGRTTLWRKMKDLEK